MEFDFFKELKSMVFKLNLGVAEIHGSLDACEKIPNSIKNKFLKLESCFLIFENFVNRYVTMRENELNRRFTLITFAENQKRDKQ